MEAVELDVHDFLYQKNKNIVFYKLNGNSLSGTNLQHGSIVAVDTKCEANNNDYIVAAINDCIFVKKLFRKFGITVLYSKHKDYKKYIINCSNFKIIGVVKYVVASPQTCDYRCEDK